MEERTRRMQNVPYTRKKPEQQGKRKPEQGSGMLDVSALGVGTLAHCCHLATIARRLALATNARPLTARFQMISDFNLEGNQFIKRMDIAQIQGAYIYRPC